MVKTNLAAQKLRLLFVADSIPRDLRRIVEYLNEQMRSTEVLALELKQYTGQNNLRTVAPTIYGQTEVARTSKAVGESKIWTEESFFEQLKSQVDPAAVAVAKRLLEWQKQNAVSIIYGRGIKDGSLTGHLLHGGAKFYPLVPWTNGKAYFNFRDCMKSPFDSDSKRLEFLEQLNRVPGIKLPSDCIAKQPSIKMADLALDDRVEMLLKALDWFKLQLA